MKKKMFLKGACIALMAAVVGFTMTACDVVSAVVESLVPKMVTVQNMPASYRSTTTTPKYGQLGVANGNNWNSVIACSNVVEIPVSGNVEFILSSNDSERKPWNAWADDGRTYRLVILMYDTSGDYDAVNSPTYWAATSSLALRQQNTLVEWRQFVSKTGDFTKSIDIRHSASEQRSICINAIPAEYNGKLAYVYLEGSSGIVAFSLQTISWDTSYPNNRYTYFYLIDGTPSSTAAPVIFPSSDTGPYKIGLKIYDDIDAYKSNSVKYDGKTSSKALTAATGSSGSHNMQWSEFVEAGASLTEGVWTNGYLPASDSEQWFEFTASAATQYFHVLAGSAQYGVKIQLYEENGTTTVGSSTMLYTSTPYSATSLTSGTKYKIKVTPYAAYDTGTYKITFNADTTPPAMAFPANVTTLAANTWTNGSIATTDVEQWFKFTASAASHNIHFDPGALKIVYVQLYKSDGSKEGSEEQMGNTSTPKLTVSRTVTSGSEYYIRVRTNDASNSGAYKIAFNTSATPPGISVPANATALTANTWTNGNIPTAGGEQWFKFTATAATQYIHFNPGEVDGALVRLYTSNGSTVGEPVELSLVSLYLSQTVVNGTEYYIRVTNTGTTSGNYKITFSTTNIPPSTVTIPPANAITLTTADTWVSGNIATAGGEQWFKFTATAATQYIHFQQGTGDTALTLAVVQLYNSTGSTIESSVYLYNGIPSPSRTVTSGQEYYIRVTPYMSTLSGAFKIAFGATNIAPPTVALPTTGVTDLTAANTWVNSNIATAGGEQWFKFTATDTTQYIHFQPGTGTNDLTQVYVEFFVVKGTDTINGTPIGSKTNLYSSRPSTSQTVTSGAVCYIKVTPYSNTGSGAFKIGFSATDIVPPSVTIPTTGVTELTAADTWVNGNITTAGGEQWFKFTATAATQYIHFQPGTGTNGLTSVYVELFVMNGTATINGSAIGDKTNLPLLSLSTSQTVTIGTAYYIKVTPWISSNSGEFKIAFGATDIVPPSVTIPATGVTELTAANTWVNGNIAAAGEEQWFKFTATDLFQYIHFQTGTLDDVYVEFFVMNGTAAINGSAIGSKTNLWSSKTSTTQLLTSGTVYYIKVTPYGTKSGAFKIGFNTSATAPTS
jgi:hypothetical protein